MPLVYAIKIKPRTNSFCGEASLKALGYTWPALMVRCAQKRNKEDELITNLCPDKTFWSRMPGGDSNLGINVQMAIVIEKVKGNCDVLGYLHQSATNSNTAFQGRHPCTVVYLQVPFTLYATKQCGSVPASTSPMTII